MSEHSIGDLADWIIKYRKGGAFKDDSWENLVVGLTEDIKNNNVLYVWDDIENNYTGVVTFICDIGHSIIFVKNIIVTKHSALVVFIRYFNMRYANYCIAANRNDEEVNYNTFRLMHLLLKIQLRRS